MGAGQRLRMERVRVHVQCGGGGWAPSHHTVGAGERVRLGRGDMQCGGGGGRAPFGITVGARKRLRLGPVDVQ